jgi:hypothetical protein
MKNYSKTINGVDLKFITYKRSNKNVHEVYVSGNLQNVKMFIDESHSTGKCLKASVHMNDTTFDMSNKYDLNTALDKFTQLVNMFNLYTLNK